MTETCPACPHHPTLLSWIFETWSSYKPLIIILIFCSLLSVAPSPTHEAMMTSFMGYFFVFLSLFKFFDLRGFAQGFSSYDLMAQRLRYYGYVYPFIELFLGLAYLMRVELYLVNVATVLIMTISGLGVVRSVFSGQTIKCACLGTVLNVPLSTVSILENFGMGAMAAYQLL